MIDVSVIIPCTDRVIGLKQCLESVLSQCFIGKLEVLLVENNSLDRSIIPNLVSLINDDRVNHVYMDKCDNANWARNFGVEISLGKYIAFLDSDDWWELEHIKKCLVLIGNGASAIYSGFNLNNGFNNKIIESRPFLLNETAYDFLFSSKSSFAQTSSFFLKRDVLDKCKWDNGLKRNQDYDFFINVQQYFRWTWNENITTNVYWPVGSARTYSSIAFEFFYEKHKISMSPLNKSFYLLEILIALSSVNKSEFDFFAKKIVPHRSHLNFLKRIYTYNYYLTRCICKSKDLVRKFF